MCISKCYLSSQLAAAQCWEAELQLSAAFQWVSRDPTAHLIHTEPTHLHCSLWVWFWRVHKAVFVSAGSYTEDVVMCVLFSPCLSFLSWRFFLFQGLKKPKQNSKTPYLKLWGSSVESANHSFYVGVQSLPKCRRAPAVTSVHPLGLGRALTFIERSNTHQISLLWFSPGQSFGCCSVCLAWYGSRKSLSTAVMSTGVQVSILPPPTGRMETSTRRHCGSVTNCGEPCSPTPTWGSLLLIPHQCHGFYSIYSDFKHLSCVQEFSSMCIKNTLIPGRCFTSVQVWRCPINLTCTVWCTTCTWLNSA